MKLAFRPFELKLMHEWTVASSCNEVGKRVAHSLIVELTDRALHMGFGESAPPARYDQDLASAVEFFRRVDPSRLSFRDLWASIRYLEGLSRSERSARGAVEIALLDGAARQQGKPLHECLGFGFREHHHITSFSIGISHPETIREKVVAASAFPVLKLKVGSPHDIRNLAALRSVAPDKYVRVDANEAWRTKEEALKRLEWLATDGRIQFVEQPMPAQTAQQDLKWLKDRSPLPLFADESYHTAHDVESVSAAFHGVNVKLCKTGGIMRAAEALQAARDQGLKTMLGCMIETSVLISAAAHLAELCDFFDLDGNLLTTNDPFIGLTARNGVLSFAHAKERCGIMVSPR